MCLPLGGGTLWSPPAELASAAGHSGSPRTTWDCKNKGAYTYALNEDPFLSHVCTPLTLVKTLVSSWGFGEDLEGRVHWFAWPCRCLISSVDFAAFMANCGMMTFIFRSPIRTLLCSALGQKLLFLFSMNFLT